MAKTVKQKFSVQSNNENLIAHILLPGSKSISNRALILKEIIAQKTGKTIDIKNLSAAEDTQILISALAQKQGSVNIQNAGTCLRFLCAYFAASEGSDIILTGSDRMKERPIAPLIEALRNMGANIQYLEENNCLPIQIKGTKLKGGKVNVSGSLSSQFISALMLISPLLETPIQIDMEGELVSKEYIKLTQTLLEQFGIGCIQTENIDNIQVKELDPNKIPETYTVEADWSSAAFFYEAAVLAEKADIFFENLYLNSIQGDSILAQWMEGFGIKSFQKETGIAITKTRISGATPTQLNFINHPDLAPAFICATAGAYMPFNAEGISSLQHKESKRISVLATALKQLHFKVTETESSLEHDGLAHAFYQNTIIQTHQDHRMVMALAMFAVSQSVIVLNETSSVIKSFPNFWEEAAKIGITVK